MKYRLSKADQKSDIPPKPVIFVNGVAEKLEIRVLKLSWNLFMVFFFFDKIRGPPVTSMNR